MADIPSLPPEKDPLQSDHDNGQQSPQLEDPRIVAGLAQPSKLSIIGIGASAGGLAALQRFFDALPSDTGMSFAVVVHPSPVHESVLADLLQAHTAMPVQQVTVKTEVQPNHVYVIPPGKRLLVSEGHLDLEDGLITFFDITTFDITGNKEGESALRNAKEYAEAIVETIPDALIVLETDLRVRTANESFYEMFSVNCNATEGEYIYALGNGQWDIPALRILLEEILPDNKIFANYEVDHTFESIGRRTMLINGRRLDHMQLILLTITDITQRKQFEDAMIQSEARLRLVANLVPDLLWRTKPDGYTTWYNQRWLDYTGQTLTEAQGYGWLDVIHPTDRDQSLARFQRAVEKGLPFRHEHRIRSHNDEYHWFLVQMQPQRDEDNQILSWFGAATDIQEQRVALEQVQQWNEALEKRVDSRTKQVRSLVTQLTMSEQSERRRISQILHDDLQQHLFGLQFQIKNIANQLAAGDVDVIPGKLDEMNEALVTAVQLTRNLSVNLSPPVLYGEGLVEAVNWLAHQMYEQYELTVHVNAMDTVPVPHEDLRVLLFQVLRELLFNVVKHADVDEVRVSLTYHDKSISIEVTDHGIGLDVEKVMHSTQSHGLLQSRQRVELVGGELHFEAIPSGGTRVVINCPIEAE